MKLTYYIFNQNEKKKSFQCLKETNVTLRSIKNAESTSSFDKNQTRISWRFVVKKKGLNPFTNWSTLSWKLYVGDASAIWRTKAITILCENAWAQWNWFVLLHATQYIYSSHNLHVVFSARGNRQRHKQSQRKQSCFETCNSNSVS